MRYISTRGDAPSQGFIDVALAGLAADGGLFVPERWPSIDAATIAGYAGQPYAEVACDILAKFTGGEIATGDLARMTREAYGTFRHPAVVPLVQIGPNTFVLELFHGPTLAFKDLAMQLLARLMDHALELRRERTPSWWRPPATPAAPPSRRSAAGRRPMWWCCPARVASPTCSGG